MKTPTPIVLVLLVCLSACQTTGSELGGLAAIAPLDYAVLVTGGAFLSADPADPAQPGTFFEPNAESGSVGTIGSEPIAADEVVAILEQGRVFRRVALDMDVDHRRSVSEQLASGSGPDLQAFLQNARDEGYDFVLVIEKLQDGPIEEQGINGRWPVTFATWILLGVGSLIPDHTFESRATLRVSLRDLQTGRLLYERSLASGPIDLALTERTDVLGLVLSILVPPFWVANDRENLMASVQLVTRRRLLFDLARDLKSGSVRQRLREGSAAGFSLVSGADGSELVVDAAESLSAVRLRSEPSLSDAASDDFAAALLSSVQSIDGRFHYRAPLPAGAQGRLVQILVATIRGSVASATFAPGSDQ